MFEERFREITDQVEALRREREERMAQVDRKSRVLLETLENALK
jgi:hypothetical protein